MNALLGKITVFRIFVLVGVGILIIDIAKPITAFLLQSETSEIILTTGKWQADVVQPDEQGSYIIRKTVEFVWPNKIIYNQLLLRNGRLDKIEYYNLSFRYQFVSENQIELSARVGDEWEITTKGRNLVISEASFVGNGEYERVNSLSWHLIAILIGLLVYWVYHVLYLSYIDYKKHPSGSVDNELFGAPPSHLNQLGNALIVAVMLGIGAYFGTIAWSWWPRLFIRYPWDGVILLEINMLILSFGLRWIMNHVTKDEASHFVATKWQYYIGILLGSLGFSGSLVSLLLLTLSIITRGFLL